MKQIKRYTISELAEASGISRRSVRFYVQTGVIPPPVGLGRFCYYTDEHLAAIRLRRQPVEAALPLPHLYAPEDMASITSAITVTRVTLGEGVVLELPAGCNLPDREQTMMLQSIIKQLLTNGSNNANK